MRTFAILIAAALLFQAAGFAQNEGGSHARFTRSGFSIMPLEAEPGGIYTPLVMTLPASNGFASNVNVMIQPFDKTMADYVELSQKQVKDLGLTIIQVKQPNPEESVFEYSGQLQNNKLHWYARAIKKGAFVYLATATCPDAEWAKYSRQLVPCVDSLKLP